MSIKPKIKISSNRNFGLVFSFVFIIISFWPLLDGENVRNWSLILAVVFFILALINSNILYPLNLLWFKFGLLLGNLIAPLIMGFVFFFVVTPTGIFMRIIGKDILKKKFERKIKTYWIKRAKSKSTMKQQF